MHSIQEIFQSSTNIDPNQCNKHGESLLHYCAGMGQLDIFKFLIKMGADIGVIDDVSCSGGGFVCLIESFSLAARRHCRPLGSSTKSRSNHSLCLRADRLD